MGQIIGSAAKPKRCNLSQLSQLGTPAAGEHILVSSDNSMNAAGQGNFDCYIEGDGTKAATALTLHAIADATPTSGSKNAVTSGGAYASINGQRQNYQIGSYYKTNYQLASDADWAIMTDFVPVQIGDEVTWNAGTSNSSACMLLYDATLVPVGYYGSSSAPRTVTIPNTTTAVYARISFAIAQKDKVYISVNGHKVWEPKSEVVGLGDAISKLLTTTGVTLPNSNAQVVAYFNRGYLYKTNGTINQNSSVNSYSQRIDVAGYKKVRFVGNRNSASSDECAAFYDANGTFLSSFLYYDSTAESNTYTTYELDIPANAKYFAFTIQNIYIQYATNVELILDSLKDDISAIRTDVNSLLAKPLEWEDGYQIYTNEGAGNTCHLYKYSAPTFRCLNVSCTAGQKVFITKANGGKNPRMWCFLNSSNVILQVSDASASIEALELTAPEGTAKLICNDTLKTGNVYIYDGDKPISLKVDLLDEDSGADIQHGRTSNCKDFGTQPAADGTDGSFCDIKNSGYTQLLSAVYEPLRAAYPNYISRELIGQDASGTIDMYAYVFEPRYYQQSVYLQAGIHGVEIDAVACLARIMQLIANATDADEDLMWLRQNVKFTIIPCVNVWGISQSPKNNNNADDAQLQQWSATTPPAEVENVKAYIADKSLTNELSFMLDMHTTTNDTYYDFYGNIQKHAKNVRTIFRTNSWLCDNYAKDGRTVDDQYLGYYEPANYPLFRQWYYYMYGVQTATLELSDFHWDSHKSTSPVITMGVTMWLNYIIQMVNDYYRSMFDIPEEDYRQSRG